MCWGIDALYALLLPSNLALTMRPWPTCSLGLARSWQPLERLERVSARNSWAGSGGRLGGKRRQPDEHWGSVFSAFGPAGDVREDFEGIEPSAKPVRHFGARRTGTGLGWQQVRGKVLLLVVDIVHQFDYSTDCGFRGCYSFEARRNDVFCTGSGCFLVTIQCGKRLNWQLLKFTKISMKKSRFFI